MHSQTSPHAHCHPHAPPPSSKLPLSPAQHLSAETAANALRQEEGVLAFKEVVDAQGSKVVFGDFGCSMAPPSGQDFQGLVVDAAFGTMTL